MAALSTTSDREFMDSLAHRLSRYDIHLVGIPLVLVLSILAHVLLGMPFQTALVAASLVSACVIADAVFLNPPVGRRGAT